MSDTTIVKLENATQRMKSLEKEASIREKEELISKFNNVYDTLARKKLDPEQQKYADQLRAEFIERATRIGVNRKQMFRL